jgi:hypothetical protein
LLLADPFLVKAFKIYKPSHKRARQLASTHRGTIGYAKSDEILRKEGLYLCRKEYYNLTWKETTALLLNQEKLQLVMTILEQNSFYLRTREEYIVENGIRTKHVIKDIFFMSDKQIRFTRQFVSGFMYKTDATFNTNTC